MAASNPLLLSKVIDDVIDMFVPYVNMDVYYGSKHVSSGCVLKPSVVDQPPRVVISGNSEELYCLIMTDPDAPNPSEPSMREYIHWIVVDIPGGTNSSKGLEILSYESPYPPRGIHRYVFVLFKQHGSLKNIEPPQQREFFNTRDFARSLGLGCPVATAFYNGQKEPLFKRQRV